MCMVWRLCRKPIADARENAKNNQMENATFYVGKAEEVLPTMGRRACRGWGCRICTRM